MSQIEDERILAEKRKINSRAFGICYIALWLILLYRQFVLQQDVYQYLDILLLVVGLSLYLTLNSILRGLYLSYRTKQVRRKSVLIGAIVGGVTFTAVKYFIMNDMLTNMNDVAELILSFLIFAVAWMLAQGFLINISESKANQDIKE